MAFNPNNFFTTTKVEDIIEKFPKLKENDYSKISLKDELTKLNFEIISATYIDFKYKDISEYYDLEIDTII